MQDKIQKNFSFYFKLYYEFGGNFDWLKEEIIKKRYDSFKYLIPVRDREKANIILEHFSYKNEKLEYITITAHKKIVNIFKVQKKICENLAINEYDRKNIYPYLKETIYDVSKEENEKNRNRK